MLDQGVETIRERNDSGVSASDQTSEWPMVTVIVPVRNEERHLANTVKLIAGQDYPVDRFEILIVDGCSTDGTRAIAERLAGRIPNIRVLENPGRLSSRARNIGIRESFGDLIVIIDGHCEFDDRSYLRNVASAFERSGADCLGRPQPLNVSGASLLQRAIAAARSSWLGHHPDSFIYSGVEQVVPAKSVAVAYRREVFDRVGLFDEAFDACEDVELNHRVDEAGLKCLFAPSIAAAYVPRSSLGGLFRQMARYGRGRMRLFRKHPDTFSLGSFAPALWLAGLFLGPLAGLAYVPLWWIYLGSVAIYLAAVVSASIQVAWQHCEARFLLLAPVVLVTVHAGTGWGVLGEALKTYPALRRQDNQEGQPCTS
jgi:succinoglycan biosynthesis protein ExoA